MPEANGVLITRPEPDASETARRIEAIGFEPVIAPLLTVRTRKLATSGTYDAILVTSRNAISAVPETLRGVTLLAVGGATAARAREAGFATVADADGDAADLLALARGSLAPGSRLLFVHGTGQGDALAAALAEAGFAVTRRRGYGAVTARRLPHVASDALQARRLRAATFLSAATARAFVRLLPGPLVPTLQSVDAAVIGPGAAAALAPLPFRRVRVSLKPTLEEVLALL